MKNFLPIGMKTLTAASLGVLLTACANNLTELAEVEEARQSWDELSANPNKDEYAPIAYDIAKEEVQKLERMIDDGAAEKFVFQQAYITNRKIDIAQANIREAMARDLIDSSDERRQLIVLKARERELQAAKRRAEELQVEVMQSKAEADAVRMEAMAQREQADEMKQRAMDLQNQVANLKAKETDRGLVLTLDNILFEVGKSELKPGASRTLDKIADFLSDQPDQSVIVEGFTDSTGSDDFNMQLSQERAASVRRYLVSQGIDRSQITARGYGEQYPVASNDTTVGRQQNRRVEIVLSDQSRESVSQR